MVDNILKWIYDYVKDSGMPILPVRKQNISMFYLLTKSVFLCTIKRRKIGIAYLNLLKLFALII